MLFNSCPQRQRSMLFHFAHNMFKVIAMRTNDHVDMAGHDAISINFKAFILLAMFPAGNHYIFVFVSDEKVYPIYHRKTYKIKLVLVVEFIFAAHYKLKIRDWILSCKKGLNKCCLAVQHSGLPVSGARAATSFGLCPTCSRLRRGWLLPLTS